MRVGTVEITLSENIGSQTTDTTC